MKIGIFDSGIGGLSVLLQAVEALPEAEFIFFGDIKHVPYGEKTEEEVLTFVDEAVGFLDRQGVDAVVIACNTATSVAAEFLRAKYSMTIVGMEPAAKKALDMFFNRRTLVIATPITVRGQKLQSLIGRIDKKGLVDLHPMPGLVHFAETCNFNKEEVIAYLEEELGDYDWSQYSSVVLGCTHFNYFKDILKDYIPGNVVFLDGNEGTINQLIRKLKENNVMPGFFASLGKGSAANVDEVKENASLPENSIPAYPNVRFYYSGEPVTDEKELKRIEFLLDRLKIMRTIK